MRNRSTAIQKPEHTGRNTLKILHELGGVDVDGHNSTFFFAELGLLLTVYVDDLLLSGPVDAHTLFWDVLKGKVNLEEISGLGRFLGRYHEVIQLNNKPALAFGVADYVKSACDLYESLPGASKLKRVATPFVSDGSLCAEDDEIKGALSDNACEVLVKCLWVARLARPDIIRPITLLATKIQCWSRNCDKQLHRLISYMSSTIDLKITGQILDDPQQLELALFVDADFAGDRDDAKSSSGALLVLKGPNTWFPLTWIAKKQSAVSRSTTEAELISMAYALFSEALPMLNLWDRLLKRPVKLRILKTMKRQSKW